MRVSHLAAAVVVTGLLSARPAALRQDAPPARMEAMEGTLARGESHEHPFVLSASEHLRVRVDQRGIDLAVQVRDPGGATIGLFDHEFTTAGGEDVEITSTTAGTYTLVVRPAAGAIGSGGFAIRVVDRRLATDADRAVQQARTLVVGASRLEDAGKLDDARVQLERALALGESAQGPNSPFVMVLVFDLAANALDRRDNTRADLLLQRALTVLDATVGPDDPFDAVVRSRLAILYSRLGQRPKADAYARQANQVFEQTLGTKHLWYVRNLGTLANLRLEAGDIERSKELVERAIAILDTIQETDGLLYAGLLNNLGNLDRETGDYDRANELLQRALTAGERLRGPDSFYVSTTLQNLGIVARERKEYAAAEAYEMRALRIRETLVGPDHPDVAQILINLANIYRSNGDVQKSLDTQHRALSIWERTAGPYERGTMLSAGNLARAYAGLGDVPHWLEFQRRTEELVELQLALDLSTGSERDRLASARAIAERTDRTLSLHLNLAPSDPGAASLAALVLLQRKGRVLDAMTDTLTAVRRHADARDIAILDELHVTTTKLADAALKLPMGPARQQAIKDLEARKEHLEQELSAHSNEFRAQTLPVTLEAVQAAIPEDAALVEFAVFRPFDPKIEHNAEAYGPPHYAAYVIRPRRQVVGFDLGLAQPIEVNVNALREALRDPRCNDVSRKARAIDARIMEPLRAAIGGATRLLVAPDGALNLVPFDAFVDEGGQYLIHRYAITYLTSGRDLLRLQVPRASQSRSIIVANPLFGEPARAAAPSASGTRSAEPGSGPGGMYFAPLPSATLEARAIKDLFPDATLLTGRDATESRLATLNAPRMLHIASHGFFLKDASAVANPLLRSGLALAGANLPGAAGNDGVLTALEATGLNLWGTKLVTLSACDTGVGEVRNGEGVYGLRRAFVLAGTETLVMSLWPVSDRITRETMTTYYTGLRAGLGRGDALRHAKLAVLEHSQWSHPYYWASFIQSGEWANLDGKR